ncbi:hypothetical protein [Burkholderia diffusa]|nr:hypothetical protein [Burkholderia diffusa]
MTARFICPLALDEASRARAAVGKRVAAWIEPRSVAHFIAQGTAVKAIA